MNYLDLTISEIHQALVDKKVTSLELVKESIARIKKDENNSYEATNFEKAIEIASKIDKVLPEEILKGIPYVAKDNYSTKGIETTASSNILAGYVPTFDAEVIERLNKAGAILVAKTTLDELAMGGTGLSGHKGATSNPYDKERIIGGSSCGSCASVAKCDVPFSLGSDTGDSVRKPAGFGGLVGMKPTWGRISRFGLFPFAPSMDTVGYFTRSVEDSAIITNLLSGHDDKDMSSSYRESENYLEYLKKPNEKKKIAYFKSIIDCIEDKAIVDNFYDVIKKLEGEGYSVTNYDFPQELLNALYPVYMVLSCSEATSNDANLDGVKFGIKPTGKAKTWEEYMMDARTNGFSPLIKRRFVIGSFSLLAENQEELFKRAQKARRIIVDEMNKFFEKNDYLLLPVAKSVAPLIKESSDKWNPHPNFVDNHLGLANLGGFPSLTVPSGYEGDLPFGINMTARQFEEGNLFALGKDVENITGLKNTSTKKRGIK
ncbi:MAG: amidase family protein [Bacilli bacterium]